MKVKKIALTVLLGLCLCLAASGVVLAMSSANYNLPWKVFSSGGGLKSSSSYRLGDTIGQSATGVLQSSSYRLESGLWTGAGAIALPGDATGDGSINALDITKVERIIAGLDVLTSGADANQDGKMNAQDITKVERLIAGLD